MDKSLRYLLACVIALGAAACAPAAHQLPVDPPASAAARVAAPAPSPRIRMAIAGDSLTTWKNLSFPDPIDDPAGFDEVTWTHWAMLDGIELVGGGALGGATVHGIANLMVPVDADVLVIMVSTNDVAVIDPASLEGEVMRIVETAGPGVEHVLLSAIPPFERYSNILHEADTAMVHNAEFKRMAEAHGWSYVDPWVQVRAADNHWVAGYSVDLVHPTAEAAHLAADVLVEEIRAIHWRATLDALHSL